MQTYTFGIIGAGMIAEKHLEALKLTNRGRVKWVVRSTTGKLREFQEKWNIDRGTTDYKELLADTEVDAIIIASPPKYHADMFKECLNNGKHVLIEKPMGMNRTEVADMVAYKNRFPNLKVCDCSCRHSRLQPKFGLVKKIIDSGELGTVYYIHHNAVSRQSRPGIEYHPTAKWFLNKEIAGGGPLFDWGVYDLSFHLGVLGDKHELVAVKHAFMKNRLDLVDAGTDIYDVEEHFSVSMQFTNQLSYYWERASHANMDAPNETRIYGTRAGLKLAFCTWDEPVIELFQTEQGGRGKAITKKLKVDSGEHSDDFELARHFIDVLDGKAAPAMTPELAKKHLEIIFSCYEATNFSGKAIHVKRTN
jgi:predicted dehydrogenase